MVALTTWPLTGCGIPVIAHSSTEGWDITALSTSKGPIR